MTDDKTELTAAAKLVWKGIGGVIGAVLFFCFVALIFLLIWNVAVVGLVTAAAGHVAVISFKTAFAAGFGLFFLRNFAKSFKSKPSITVHNVFLDKPKDEDDRVSSD